MDPRRKRKLRLIVALLCALALTGALIYESFATSSRAASPSELKRSARSGRVYQLTGKVQVGSVDRGSEALHFRVRDRDGTTAVPVRYVGAIPDPFREDREVLVSVRKQGDVFVGEKDSLVTKCPSKFSAEQQK